MKKKETFRVRVVSCIHPETYKYFLRDDFVDKFWKILGEKYEKKVSVLGLVSIETEAFIFQSNALLNPVQVMRKKKCKDKDVEEFHKFINFTE